jgi:TctA family transporter
MSDLELLSNLALGFGVALSWQNLLYCLIGALLGTLIGVLPGIGPVTTIAMLLPITFKLEPTSALIMLAGIYYGCQYGGSTTAILVNLPGEASSIVTTLDGHQMARQGRAGDALAVAALGSFFAGCVGTLLIAAAGPPLANVAQKFGPAEYFSLMTLGLVASVVMAHGSVLKSFANIIGSTSANTTATSAQAPEIAAAMTMRAPVNSRPFSSFPRITARACAPVLNNPSEEIVAKNRKRFTMNFRSP